MVSGLQDGKLYPEGYPATEIGKNLLCVAITRASNRLAIYHHEPLTGLLCDGPVEEVGI
jgi:hypothetical protein